MIYYAWRIIMSRSLSIARRLSPRRALQSMSDDTSNHTHLPDSGAAPPQRDPNRLWHYAATQWRRLFGLNVSQIDELLFVGGEFTPAQWPDLYILGVRAILSLQAERADEFEGSPP